MTELAIHHSETSGINIVFCLHPSRAAWVLSFICIFLKRLISLHPLRHNSRSSWKVNILQGGWGRESNREQSCFSWNPNSFKATTCKPVSAKSLLNRFTEAAPARGRWKCCGVIKSLCRIVGQDPGVEIFITQVCVDWVWGLHRGSHFKVQVVKLYKGCGPARPACISLSLFFFLIKRTAGLSWENIPLQQQQSHCGSFPGVSVGWAAPPAEQILEDRHL